MLLGTFSLLAVPTVQKDKKGNAILENKFIRAVVAPVGGNVIIFEDKVKKINHAVSDDLSAGLGKLRGFENLGCREFYSGMNEIKIRQLDKDEALVECSYTASDKANPWCGFEVIKKYFLRNGENRLRLELTINSHSNTGVMSPFMHNYLTLREKSYAFAQTSQGLFCRQIQAQAANKSTCMVRNISEPWSAIVSPVTQDGIIGYDASEKTKAILFWLNESKPTMEPLFETMKFANDASWKCTYWLAPLRGLASCHFATSDYAAGFCMEKDDCVLKFLPFSSLGKINLKVHQGDKLLAEFTFDTIAGETLTQPIALPKELQQLKIEVSLGGRSIVHNIWASPLPEGQVKGNAELKKDPEGDRKYAKCHVAKEKLFVSPDITAPFGCFSVKDKLDAKDKKTLKLIIDVPKGITLLNPIAQWGTCHDQISKSEIQIKDQPYNRYMVSKLSFRNTIFVQTDWQPGQKGIIYYQLKWDGGEDSAKQVPVEAVSVPVAPFPKQLITNIPGFGMYQRYIDHWPGFYEVMMRVGCNTISSSQGALRGNPDKLKEFFRKAQEKGFYTFANFSPFGLVRKGSKEYSEPIEKFCAVSLTGQKSNWPCPSYRGKAFQDYVEKIAAAGTLGASMLALDTEMWSGADYCYCERCLGRFKEFMKQRYPNMAYKDPREFRKYPEKYPEYLKVWDNFKAMLGCELYRPIAEKFQQNIEKAKTPGPYMFGTYAGIQSDKIYSMFLRLDDLLEEGIVNHVEPSPYTRGDALKFAEAVKRAREVSGNSNILTWMSAGLVYEEDPPGRDFRYCLLENFMNGARGYLILPWYGVDVEDLREHAIAMRMIVPVEDIIIDGSIMKHLRTSSGDVKICGLQKGTEQLILLSEYYGKKATPVSFKTVLEEDCRAINMLTGEFIATLPKGSATINAVIPKDDRAVLIYIGNRKFNTFDHQDISKHEKQNPETKPFDTMNNPQNTPSVPTGIQGKLTVEEQKYNIIISNPFYHLNLSTNSGNNELKFVQSGKKLKFYYTSSTVFETKRIYFLNNKTKKSITRSSDGQKVIVDLTGISESNSYKITYRISFIFYADRPVFEFKANLEQDPIVNYRGGSLDTWNFNAKVQQAMPFYCTGPTPEKNGKLVDRIGNAITPGWKSPYKYLALTDNTDAFGMIISGKENALIYIYDQKNNGGGYITGCRRILKGKKLDCHHYVYAGPLSDLKGWAEKLYSKVISCKKMEK
jgi:hypothetical protein